MLHTTVFRASALLAALTVALFPIVAWGQPTTVNLDRSAGPARLWLSGEAGRDYTLQASDAGMASNSWQFLITTPLTNAPLSWFDANSMLLPSRFYRAVKLAPVSPQPAANFRLIDHLGRSRELNYYLSNSPVPAVVLIFTGNGCAKIRDLLPTIRSLTNRFNPSGVLFWMIDSNSNDNRSNILAEATSLGITLPILHDRAQLVARSYQATTTPEVIALRKYYFPGPTPATNWSVFYRGSIDDRLGSNAVATTQFYLSNALVNFLAGQPVAPTESRPAGCDITLLPRQTNITYSADIGPLILDKCVRCHSPGNIAPFTYSSYSIVKGKAPFIRENVLAGRMPPWHADYNYGVFTNDASLTPTQAATLIQWIDDGAVRGSGPDPLASVPPATNYPVVWPPSLGTPSNIINLATQAIPATGTIDYRYWNYTYTGPTVWLRAAVVLPGTLSAVHHILAYKSGVDDTLHSFMTGYVPGSEMGAFPTDTGKLLTNGTVIRFQMHYVANGSATTDVSQLGLYTMPSAPLYPLIQSSAPNAFFIPANTPDYETNTASFLLSASKSVKLYELSPHLHTRGSRFKYEAIYPSGHVPASEVLLSVANYVFHWQTTYRFAQPKILPPGTSIRCTCAWDNSVQNQELMALYNDPDNPNNFQYSPNQPVYWGDQTWNEMFIGYFNYSEIP